MSVLKPLSRTSLPPALCLTHHIAYHTVPYHFSCILAVASSHQYTASRIPYRKSTLLLPTLVRPHNKERPYNVPNAQAYSSRALFIDSSLRTHHNTFDLQTKHTTPVATMSNYHYGVPHYPSIPSHSSHNSHGHHGRSRRGPRISSQNAHRQYKAQRSPKEAPEPPAYSEYLQRLEAAKSFEFDDDELFCPFHLLTEDDVCRLIRTFNQSAA